MGAENAKIQNYKFKKTLNLKLKNNKNAKLIIK